jgi:integrase
MLQTVSYTFDNTHFPESFREDFLDAGAAENGGGRVQSIATEVGIPEGVSQYLTAAIADSTRRAYQADFADFLQWGGHVPCSPEVVATYIAQRADTLSPATLTRRLVAIGRAHSCQNLPDPTKADLVRTVMRGIRRQHGTAQRQVAPLTKQDLLSMLPLMVGVKGLRDRALILLGFAAALRRSELVALDVADLAFINEGLIVTLRKSKSDQEGQGRKIGVPWGRTAACPVKAVQAWLDHARIENGAIFRCVNRGSVIGERLSDHAVAVVIKSYAKAIGLDPNSVSGHSLRSGLATAAAQAGIPAHKIMAQTGHRSLEMLNRYIRDGNLFIDNASGGVL